MSGVTDWLSDVGSDIVVGLDDAACGWEEMVTGKRRERLEAAAARLQRSLDNAAAIEQLYGELTRSHSEVMQAIALSANKFSAHFKREGEGWGLDTMRVARTAGTLISGLAATSGLVARPIGYLSTLWSTAGSAGRIATTATQAEMTVISNLVSAGADAAAISNATKASTVAVTATNASKFKSFAGAAGKVALVAGAIVVILQTVLQGIEVAHMRNELKRIEEERTKLAPILVKMQDLMKELREELQSVYMRVAIEEPGKHVAELKNAGENSTTRVVLEEFFTNIATLVGMMDTETTTAQKTFQDLRATVSSQNATVRAALSQKLIEAGASVTVAQSKLETAFESLKEGLSVAKVAKITKLDIAIVQRLADLCAGAADPDAVVPRMSMDPAGQISLYLDAA